MSKIATLAFNVVVILAYIFTAIAPTLNDWVRIATFTIGSILGLVCMGVGYNKDNKVKEKCGDACGNLDRDECKTFLGNPSSETIKEKCQNKRENSDLIFITGLILSSPLILVVISQVPIHSRF